MTTTLHCQSFDAGLCRSCQFLPVPYAEQLQRKQQALSSLPIAPDCWLPPVASEISGFRNKAKMVVLGTGDEPVLGISHASGAVDLTGCALYPADFQQAFAHIKGFIQHVGMQPYQLSTRKGELKYILLSRPDATGGWMLRFVLRSQHHVAALRKHLPSLQARWPELLVCSANIQPEHKAVLEGELEIILSQQHRLRVELNDVPLYLSVQSFFQTNSRVAAALYQTAREWTAELPVSRIWDLFCGVGGFALHVATAQRQVTGIEISPQAIEAATQSAQDLGVRIDFRALDATAFSLSQQQSPELLIVNPPRRGLGEPLCAQILTLQPDYLLYSSCNPVTLQADLARLANYQPLKAQLFDMFAHTEHAEVLVLLQRR